jgi:hypothetical protein
MGGWFPPKPRKGSGQPNRGKEKMDNVTYPAHDAPIKITLYPCEDFGGWEIIVTTANGDEEGEHTWVETKAEAIKEGRRKYNANPTIKKLVALNKEHWEERNGRLVLANDETVIRERNK